MAKVKPCTVYLVRHGQSEWNVKWLMQGKTSGVPLTKAGIAQARALADKLAPVRLAAIFSSDLLRARQTAQIVAFRRQLPVMTTPALRERSFGLFEGKTLEEYEQKRKLVLNRFHALPDRAKFAFEFPHQIESLGKTIDRIMVWLNDVGRQFAGKNVLAVAHGGVLRLLLIYLNFGSYRQLPPFSIANTACIVLKSTGKKLTIVSVEGVKKNES